MKFLNDGWQEEYFSMRFSLTMIVGAILVHLSSIIFVKMVTINLGLCSGGIKNIHFPYEYLFDSISYFLSHYATKYFPPGMPTHIIEYYYVIFLFKATYLIFILDLSIKKNKVFFYLLLFYILLYLIFPVVIRYFSSIFFPSYNTYCSPIFFITSQRILSLCLFTLGITNIIIKFTSNHHKNSQTER